MIALSFLVLRRAVDGLLGFLLLDLFTDGGAPPILWHRFCALPDLSKIGVITVLVILGSVALEVARAVDAWLKSNLSHRS